MNSDFTKNTKPTTRNRTGFTLLEMMVALAIFTVLMSTLFSFLHSMSEHVSTETIFGSLDSSANRAITEMSKKLVDCSITAPTGMVTTTTTPFTNSSIVFKNPIDLNADGLAREFGIADTTFGCTLDAPVGFIGVSGWTSFSFVKDEDIAESKYGKINNDGDKNDTFSYGWLVATFRKDDGSKHQRYFLERVILAAGSDSDGYGGDVDGDGVDDPIFSRTGNVLTINVWVYRRNEVGKKLLHNAKTQVALLNN